MHCHINETEFGQSLFYLSSPSALFLWFPAELDSITLLDVSLSPGRFQFSHVSIQPPLFTQKLSLRKSPAIYVLDGAALPFPEVKLPSKSKRSYHPKLATGQCPD